MCVWGSWTGDMKIQEAKVSTALSSPRCSLSQAWALLEGSRLLPTTRPADEGPGAVALTIHRMSKHEKNVSSNSFAFSLGQSVLKG